MAAPAAIASPSALPICSMRRASMVMSWVAEAIAMTSPIATTPARFAVGSTVLHKPRETRITAWSTTIQARRCPRRSESQGTRIRSMSGAQRKLKA